jgi:hypothetical protein
MPMILLALVISWALVRAAEETWGHAKVATATARTKLDQTVRDRIKAKHWIPGRTKGTWWPFVGFTSLWLTGKTLKHGWGVSKAVGRGVRKGAKEGRRRYAEGKAVRDAEQGRKWSWEEWADYLDDVSKQPTRGHAERVDETPEASPEPEPAKPTGEPEDIVEAEVIDTPHETADEPQTPPATEPLPALESGETPATTGTDTTGEIMTQAISGEATNLAAARAVAACIESTIADSANTVEQMMGDLSSQGVGDGTIARFYGVMEALHNTRALASAAAQGMEDDHAQVEEIIQAKSDVVASNTAFYQGG